MFVLQNASDDVTDTRVVVTCCKNNDGELGNRGVWTRDSGQWPAVEGFDWESFDNGEKEEAAFTADKIPSILDKYPKGLSQVKLASEIVKRGVARATAYRRIEEAEKLDLIKCSKSTGLYSNLHKSTS